MRGFSLQPLEGKREEGPASRLLSRKDGGKELGVMHWSPWGLRAQPLYFSLSLGLSVQDSRQKQLISPSSHCLPLVSC